MTAFEVQNAVTDFLVDKILDVSFPSIRALSFVFGNIVCVLCIEECKAVELRFMV